MWVHDSGGIGRLVSTARVSVLTFTSWPEASETLPFLRVSVLLVPFARGKAIHPLQDPHPGGALVVAKPRQLPVVAPQKGKGSRSLAIVAANFRVAPALRDSLVSPSAKGPPTLSDHLQQSNAR